MTPPLVAPPDRPTEPQEELPPDTERTPPLVWPDEVPTLVDVPHPVR